MSFYLTHALVPSFFHHAQSVRLRTRSSSLVRHFPLLFPFFFFFPIAMASKSLVSGGGDAGTRGMNWGLLAVLFAAWYGFSYLTDVLNKQIQRAHAIPVTLTLLQFLSGGLCTAFVLRHAKLHPFQPLRRSEVAKLIPISACWTLGFLSTNLSLGLSSVAFNHAVKAAEPLFLVTITVSLHVEWY